MRTPAGRLPRVMVLVPTFAAGDEPVLLVHETCYVHALLRTAWVTGTMTRLVSPTGTAAIHTRRIS